MFLLKLEQPRQQFESSFEIWVFGYDESQMKNVNERLIRGLVTKQKTSNLRKSDDTTAIDFKELNFYFIAQAIILVITQASKSCWLLSKVRKPCDREKL